MAFMLFFVVVYAACALVMGFKAEIEAGFPGKLFYAQCLMHLAWFFGAYLLGLSQGVHLLAWCPGLAMFFLGCIMGSYYKRLLADQSELKTYLYVAFEEIGALQDGGYDVTAFATMPIEPAFTELSGRKPRNSFVLVQVDLRRRNLIACIGGTFQVRALKQ